jgi:hypothetical protein
MISLAVNQKGVVPQRMYLEFIPSSSTGLLGKQKAASFRSTLKAGGQQRS